MQSNSVTDVVPYADHSVNALSRLRPWWTTAASTPCPDNVCSGYLIADSVGINRHFQALTFHTNGEKCDMQSTLLLNRCCSMSKRKNKRRKHSSTDTVAKPSVEEQKATPAKNVAGKEAKSPTRAKNSSDKPSLLSRRNMIRALIALPVAGAAGAAIHRYDVQNRGLHDLTMIGQGSPVVVQIHDPACQLCRRLMKNTRKALKSREDILFRVADVTSGEGSAFQQKHQANTVSLLIFNSAGEKVDTIAGVTPIDELKNRFVSIN